MLDRTDRTSGVTRKRLLVRTFSFLGVLALLFYMFSGTEAWPAAQVYVALLAVMGLGTGLILVRRDPALLAERMRSPIQKEQKAWDKVLIGALLLLYVGWLVLIELDAERFHWSSVPARSTSHRGDPDLCHHLQPVARRSGEQLRRAGREDTEGARPQGRDDGALRVCASPDVCRRYSVSDRHAALAWLVVGPLALTSPRRRARNPRSARRNRRSRLSSRAMPNTRSAYAIASCPTSGRRNFAIGKRLRPGVASPHLGFNRFKS